MKNLGLCFFLLCVIGAGQRGGGFGASRASAGFARGGFGPRGFAAGRFGPERFRNTVVIGGFGSPSQIFGNLGLPPLGPIPPLGGSPPFFSFDNRFGSSFLASSAFFPLASPLFVGAYDSGYAPPPIIVVQQPVPQTIIEPKPREVVQAVIHDYKQWPATAPLEPPAAPDDASFVIALGNGSRIAASAVWVQDSTVHYIDTEDRPHQVPLTSVDRQSTRELNQERNLNLHFPAPSNVKSKR